MSRKWHGLSEQEVSEAPILLKHPAIIADSVSKNGNTSVIVISNSLDYKDRPIIMSFQTDG